ILRTRFPAVDGSPVQRIGSPAALPIDVVDLREFPEAARERRALALLAEEARRPFDVTTGPLLRVTVVRLDDNDQLVQAVMHHLVCDVWSIGVLLNELAALYGALAGGAPSPLAELPLQYADWAVWQQRWL